MSDLFWLTDEQMARLQPYFPKSHGRKRVDDRRVLSGIAAQLLPEARSTTVRQELRDWFDNTLLNRLNDKATGHHLDPAAPA